MKNLFPLFAILALYSCSSTSDMTLSVKKPAPVSIPANIKTVAIVNRTEATDATKTLDAIHKAVTLQSNDLQKTGAEASVQGLTDELMKNERFTEVKQMKNLKLYSFGSGIFPTAIPWDTIQKICSETNTNAVFSLELFDTDTKLAYGATPVNLNAGSIPIPGINHQVAMTTNVKTGWRIYDPLSRTILDEYEMNSNFSFQGSSVNPVAAASGLIGRKEAVKDAGNKAGAAYATRILPYWIRVSRQYFVGGNDQFKTAQRKAQAGNWDGAAAIWKSETSNTDPKLAGRACYNMAIIAEINGDLDAAIQWAQKSYEDYKISLGLQYVKILRSRKQQSEQLDMQTASLNR